MKELMGYIIKFRINDLFIKPTQNSLIKFFRYVFVGGFAFIIDAGTLYALNTLWKIHYLIAAAAAFILGLVVNYFFSKRFVFTEQAVVKREGEFIAYGLIGVIGLGLTELFMYILTDMLSMYFMLSKVIVAIMVLIWNYMARKILLYRNK